ncbi:hypothetical protein [Microbacterium sp. RG1]|nr:hypothetical protein [Microbacterium sp. RG1]
MPDPQREAARRRGHEIFDPIVESLPEIVRDAYAFLDEITP